MGPFNTRETATAIWLVIFAVWILQKPAIRESLGDVIRSFLQLKIVASTTLLFLYVVGLIACLRAVGLWSIGLLKDSIAWFLFGGLAMMLRFATATDPTNMFREVLSDSIKIVIVLEFLVNTYTLPLALELIMVPLLGVMAVVGAVVSGKEELAKVAKLVKGVLLVAGLVILVTSISMAVADIKNLGSLDTFRSIALAPLLSILTFPLVYLMIVASQYEQLFIRLDFGAVKSPSLKRYVRRRIMVYAGLSVGRLHYLFRNHLVDLMQVREEQDVDRLLTEARSCLGTHMGKQGGDESTREY